jgi:hypothetical protein
MQAWRWKPLAAILHVLASISAFDADALGKSVAPVREFLATAVARAERVSMAGSDEPEKEVLGIGRDMDGYGRPPRRGLILLFVTRSYDYLPRVQEGNVV